MKRKNKKQKREARTKAKDLKRIQESVRILSALGMRDALKATTIYHRVTMDRYPRIEVHAAADEPQTTEVAAIVLEAKRVVGEVQFDCPLLGRINVEFFFRVVMPIFDVLMAARSLDDPELQSSLVDFRKRAADLASVNTAEAALGDLFFALDEVAMKVGRIDRRLYYWEMIQGRQENGKWAVSFSLRSTSAEMKRFRTSDGDRTGYRCGQPLYWRGITWVNWEPSLFGVPNSDHPLPVYVQGHALDKLYRREARALFLENGEWLIHDYLWQSLRNPRVHRLAGEPTKLLVEYWLNVHKLGYLVAQLVEGAVLVDTFLFLTMDGTPEGDLLRKKLKLHRRDKEQLGLDCVQTFLLSDIQSDTELVAMLTDCGCGHLFQILKDPICRNEVLQGYADDMRQYLRLAPN